VQLLGGRAIAGFKRVRRRNDIRSTLCEFPAVRTCMAVLRDEPSGFLRVDRAIASRQLLEAAVLFSTLRDTVSIDGTKRLERQRESRGRCPAN
jgi:hypothetical protein